MPNEGSLGLLKPLYLSHALLQPQTWDRGRLHVVQWFAKTKNPIYHI